MSHSKSVNPNRPGDCLVGWLACELCTMVEMATHFFRQEQGWLSLVRVASKRQKDALPSHLSPRNGPDLEL